MTTTITQDQIVEIAEAVWASLFDMTLSELNAQGRTEVARGRSATATAHISGGANVSVVLSCSEALARRAAAAMFESGEDELADEEVADAFGEIANIIAGNVKCLLPEPSELSLPTVSRGVDQVVTIPGAKLMEQVDLGCDEDRMRIALWSRRVDLGRHELVDSGRRGQ